MGGASSEAATAQQELQSALGEALGPVLGVFSGVLGVSGPGFFGGVLGGVLGFLGVWGLGSGARAGKASSWVFLALMLRNSARG